VSGEIDWEALGASLDSAGIEAEFASDPRDPQAKALGVPIWAYDMYLEMQQARQEHEDTCEAEGGCAAPSPEEAGERFVDEFVRPLEKAKVKVVWDGDKTERPADLRGTATLEVNGAGMFTLFMALRVAEGVLSQMGPLALMGAGLNPNLQDATETANLSRALATGLMSVACDAEGAIFQETAFDTTQG